MNCRRCRYDRSPISAKRSCGASTWTATTTSAIRRCREHRCALVTSQRRVLAVVGFGASAWKAAPRDRFIGWSVAQREARLQLVVNNARFLILPWVQVRNLASTVLARSSRRLPDDWQARYGYRPLLLETFVQSDRFAGTSYRAANWTHVGQTQGRGKLDVHRTHALPRKDIWLYPLRRDFRRRLCTPLDPHPNQ